MPKDSDGEIAPNVPHLGHTKGLPSRKVTSEFSLDETIKMSGEAVPVAEHDEGLRYLGYWIDAVSDWGNQVIHKRKRNVSEPQWSQRKRRERLFTSTTQS